MVTQLSVPVNDELTLDAGQVTFVGEGSERLRVITPPAITMFDQLIAYLDTKPAPPGAPYLPSMQQEGVAAAALCLRWGSYFAVLADQSKPLWRHARVKKLREEVSRISDDEMARINIEASAAMAALVDIYRAGVGGRYSDLMVKALAWVPMPQKKVSSNKASLFYALAAPEVRQQLKDALPPENIAAAMPDLVAHASRVFANALVNHGWRNGPIEDVHAGECAPEMPLDQCRITAVEVRDLMRNSAAHFQSGLNACWTMSHETPAVPWPDSAGRREAVDSDGARRRRPRRTFVCRRHRYAKCRQPDVLAAAPRF